MTHAEQFFYDNAGYSHDPKQETEEQGHMRCAVALAGAESFARSQDWAFEWEQDADGCIGCECGSEECVCCTGEPHEVLYCVLRDGCEVLASLSGICEPTREYGRVVEAELALEAMARVLEMAR